VIELGTLQRQSNAVMFSSDTVHIELKQISLYYAATHIYVFFLDMSGSLWRPKIWALHGSWQRRRRKPLSTLGMPKRKGLSEDIGAVFGKSFSDVYLPTSSTLYLVCKIQHLLEMRNPVIIDSLSNCKCHQTVNVIVNGICKMDLLALLFAEKTSMVLLEFGWASTYVGLFGQDTSFSLLSLNLEFVFFEEKDSGCQPRSYMTFSVSEVPEVQTSEGSVGEVERMDLARLIVRWMRASPPLVYSQKGSMFGWASTCVGLLGLARAFSLLPLNLEFVFVEEKDYGCQPRSYMTFSVSEVPQAQIYEESVNKEDRTDLAKLILRWMEASPPLVLFQVICVGLFGQAFSFSPSSLNLEFLFVEEKDNGCQPRSYMTFSVEVPQTQISEGLVGEVDVGAWPGPCAMLA